MTDNDQLIPPLELVEQWSPLIAIDREVVKNWQVLATHAAQWGYEQRGAVNEAELQKARDEELEACCADIHTLYGQYRADWLRLIRRPKPQSLKKQALAVLDDVSDQLDAVHENTIRRALELLDD